MPEPAERLRATCDSMDDDIAERLDNLDLAVTQIADAVEVMANLTAYDMQPVLDRLVRARDLIGTGDLPESAEDQFRP
jgi:hypothetical protein